MFREMRRNRQQLTQQQCIEILNSATSGVLAVNGDDGYPYAVPVSFVYHEGCIYFHGSVKGHKADSLRKNDKVSFCVIDMDEVSPSEVTTHYRSVIAFGRAEILEGEEKRMAAILLGEKYSRDYRDKYLDEIETTFPVLQCVRIRIEHLTGKQAKELKK